MAKPAKPPQTPSMKDATSRAVVWRLLGETGRQFAPRYMLAFLFMGIVAATTALTAWVMGDVVNKIFVARSQDMLIFLSIAVLVISLARGIGVYGTSMTLSRIGNRIVAQTQQRLYNHLLDLGVDFYDKNHSSDLVMRMSLNAAALSDVLNTLVTSFGRDLVSLVGLVAVMVIQSPTMSVIALLVGPPAIIGVTSLSKSVRNVARSEFASQGMIISVMQETAKGIRIVKAFGLEDTMRGRMGAAIDAVRRRANRIAGLAARSGPLMETLGGFAFSGVMLWAGYATIYLGQPPGAFMSFVTAIILAYEPAKRLARTQISIEANLMALRMMYELLDTKPSQNVNPDGPDLVVSQGKVVFDKVTFQYPRGSRLFNRLDFVAEPGKMTALVGPSGSGKSSMMALMERFYDLGGGNILIDGQDIAKVRLRSLHDQVGFVSQEVVLFRASVRENIRMGRPEATDAEVEAAARDAMAHDFIMATREGYDALLDDQGSKLSGGQRQRIAIARAILRSAPIILLDEATSSLDSESESQVQIAFDRLMRGRTTIVIAHRLSTVLGADRICVLVNGKIVEQGRHAELLAAGKHYARLYHLQFEKHNDAEEAKEPAPGPVAASVAAE